MSLNMNSMCPFCKINLSASKPVWPFCSERCKNADLGMWAKEEYKIAGGSIDEDNFSDTDIPDSEEELDVSWEEE